LVLLDQPRLVLRGPRSWDIPQEPLGSRETSPPRGDVPTLLSTRVLVGTTSSGAIAPSVPPGVFALWNMLLSAMFQLVFQLRRSSRFPICLPATNRDTMHDINNIFLSIWHSSCRIPNEICSAAIDPTGTKGAAQKRPHLAVPRLHPFLIVLPSACRGPPKASFWPRRGQKVAPPASQIPPTFGDHNLPSTSRPRRGSRLPPPACPEGARGGHTCWNTNNSGRGAPIGDVPRVQAQSASFGGPWHMRGPPKLA